MTPEEDDAVKPEDYAHLLSPLSLAVSLTRGRAKPYIPARHLVLLNDELVALHSRTPGRPRHLLVTMPPRHGKSELISHWFNVWNLALDPTTKIIFASYGLSLAAFFGRKVRNTVQESYPILGTSLLEDSYAGHRWQTKDGGGMESRGVKGGITGLGFNVGIVDDPIADAAQAQSKVVRDSIWDWWESTFLTRADTGDPIIILVQTRWHEDDLAGRILKQEPEQWRVVNLPALAEANDPLGREIDEALWPDRFPRERLEKIRTRRPRVFNALYQQHPAPQEGAALQRSWWRYYTEQPNLSEFEVLIQTWDPTFKDLATSDYVAGWILGLKHSCLYVLDGVKDHMNTPATMRSIKAWREKWPAAKRILIEESASGPAIIQILQHAISGITPVQTEGRSKEARLHWAVNSVAGFVESGHVFLPAYDDKAIRPNDKHVCDLAIEFVEEAASFPFAPNDDQLDAFTQGATFLMPKVWSVERRDEKEAALAAPLNPLQHHAKRMREILSKRLKARQERALEARKNGYLGSQYPGWNQ